MSAEASASFFSSSAGMDSDKDQVVIRVPTPARIMRQFMPDEAVKHMRAAQKEQLLALRCLIDAAITKIDESGEPASSSAGRRSEIPIQ